VARRAWLGIDRGDLGVWWWRHRDSRSQGMLCGGRHMQAARAHDGSCSVTEEVSRVAQRVARVSDKGACGSGKWR
jgi:hypothetical protein